MYGKISSNDFSKELYTRWSETLRFIFGRKGPRDPRSIRVDRGKIEPAVSGDYSGNREKGNGSRIY